MKKELGLVYRYQKEMALLKEVSALLGWDEQTYMPEEGIKARSEQTAYLSKLAHQKITSPEFFSAVKKLRKAGLKGKEKIMVDKLYKNITKSKKLPSEFVEEFSRQVTLAGSAWRRARKEKKFEVFAPHLEKLVGLAKKQAEYIGMPGHPYNSLLDDYEEGMTAEKIKVVFSRLKTELINLLREIKSSEVYKKQKRKMTLGKFSKEGLNEFVFDMARRIGLEEKRARIDISEHPFTTKIGFGDVRITTNFREDPLFAIGSTIHEAGHALYELGMPEKDAYNVLGDAPSVGLHESQSRFWENMVGRGKAFWKFYFPKFKSRFKLRGSFDDWYREVNFVFPGKIRIESDEVHYCLHVILRFEIELGLLDGSMKVRDLQDIWNSKMEELFGETPANDVEGVLQDVHWSMGSFGYFPTYAIGTMYAAQIYEALKREYKNVEKDIARGDFEKVRNWLKENIHKKGSVYLAEEVIKQVCGEGLNPEIYIRYLREKYGRIYRF